jgi:hypothetical protein
MAVHARLCPIDIIVRIWGPQIHPSHARLNPQLNPLHRNHSHGFASMSTAMHDVPLPYWVFAYMLRNMTVGGGVRRGTVHDVWETKLHTSQTCGD